MGKTRSFWETSDPGWHAGEVPEGKITSLQLPGRTLPKSLMQEFIDHNRQDRAEAKARREKEEAKKKAREEAEKKTCPKSPEQYSRKTYPTPAPWA